MLQGASVRTIGSACGHAKHAVGPAFQCRILFDFYSNHSLPVKIAPLYPKSTLRTCTPKHLHRRPSQRVLQEARNTQDSTWRRYCKLLKSYRGGHHLRRLRSRPGVLVRMRTKIKLPDLDLDQGVLLASFVVCVLLPVWYTCPLEGAPDADCESLLDERRVGTLGRSGDNCVQL
ncbi:hypothetical protein BDZ89DRAFT_1041759, partial [Hymenopellis radicata]